MEQSAQVSQLLVGSCRYVFLRPSKSRSFKGLGTKKAYQKKVPNLVSKNIKIHMVWGENRA